MGEPSTADCRLCHGDEFLTTDTYCGEDGPEELPTQVTFPCPCTYYDPDVDDWMEDD